ncbi:MAG TPA: hypothetical protein PL009_14580 [Flavipsychrobacter sp.]|nr:hypothetical protein [Flavipsychrobacter sp.]
MNPSCIAKSFSLFCLTLFCNTAFGQLKAYGGKQTDNHCKVIYLVNPTDSIYYIAGLNQNEVNDCRTFNSKTQTHTQKFRINVSNNETNHLLLLPKDTITYNVLMPTTSNEQEKELSILVRMSEEVIATNNDKKRNRQIMRLSPKRMNLTITER